MQLSHSIPYDGLISIANYVWDGARNTKNQSQHYFPAAWGGVTDQPVLIVNLFPPQMALAHPNQGWRFRPGLHQAISKNVHVLNIWQHDWRESSHLGHPLPVTAAICRIRAATRILEMTQPVLLISEPAHGALIGKCGERWSLWYCTDDFAAGDTRRTYSIQQNEHRLLPIVDLVLAVSPTLEEKCRPHAREVLLVPNAVDADELRGFAVETSSVAGWPPGGIQYPCVVYLGSLNERIDYPNLLQAIRQCMEMTFVFIGPVAADAGSAPYAAALTELQAAPNTVFLGRRDRREIAWLLSQCDVGIIPYLADDFNRNCSPLKVYEYSALGLPTIATPLPALQALHQHVSLADPTQLAEALRTVQTDLPQWKMHAHALLAANTWQDRVRLVQQKLHVMATS